MSDDKTAADAPAMLAHIRSQERSLKREVGDTYASRIAGAAALDALERLAARPPAMQPELCELIREAREMAPRYGRRSVIHRLAMIALPGESSAPEIELEEGGE